MKRAAKTLGLTFLIAIVAALPLLCCCFDAMVQPAQAAAAEPHCHNSEPDAVPVSADSPECECGTVIATQALAKIQPASLNLTGEDLFGKPGLSSVLYSDYPEVFIVAINSSPPFLDQGTPLYIQFRNLRI